MYVDAHVLRKIEREEQTLDDGSIVRIEEGRLLKATYYSGGGDAKNFQLTLQGAVSSLAGAAGLALASCALILSAF